MAWSANGFSLAISFPGKTSRDPGDSTVPEAWPVTYDQMRPWNAAAEKLLGVRGQPDPLRPEAAEVGLPAAPPFPADNQPLVDYLAGRGLHPYHLPMACDYTEGCATCRPTSAPSRAKTTPPAMACCPPLPSTAPTCCPNVGSCAWRPTAPRSGR